jgi:hypothetical protein
MLDKQRIEAKPGTFVNVPPNVLHSFKNETNETAKVIRILSQSGFEQFFVDVCVEVSGIDVKSPPFNNEQIQKLVSLAPKYDGVKTTLLNTTPREHLKQYWCLQHSPMVNIADRRAYPFYYITIEEKGDATAAILLLC